MLNDVKILRSRSSNACKNMIKRGNKKQIKQYFKERKGRLVLHVLLTQQFLLARLPLLPHKLPKQRLAAWL